MQLFNFFDVVPVGVVKKLITISASGKERAMGRLEHGRVPVLMVGVEQHLFCRPTISRKAHHAAVWWTICPGC
jgi:hypothetical protein